MGSLFKMLLIFSLSVFTHQAHAMWKLQKIVEKESPRSWYDSYLEKHDFEGFFKEIETRKINPNSIVSYLSKTVLEVACECDKTGEIVKKLITYGAIEKTFYLDLVWRPLIIATQYKNWEIINIFLTSEIELSHDDMNYINENVPQEFMKFF